MQKKHTETEKKLIKNFKQNNCHDFEDAFSHFTSKTLNELAVFYCFLLKIILFDIKIHEKFVATL